MTTGDTLLHPEVFHDMYFGGEILRDTLVSRGEDFARTQAGAEPIGPATIGIRTLNEAEPLERLFESIDAQRFVEAPQILVVDNESTDRTVQVAKSYGAQVLSIARAEFNYPRSMNMCLEAADNNRVMLTVGHAALATNVGLASALERFDYDERIGGVYVPPLLGFGASAVESVAAIGNIGLSTKAIEIMHRDFKHIAVEKPSISQKFVRKAKMGVMGSTNAIFRKDLWEEFGRFDEKLGMGGEDTHLADKMLKSGYSIVVDPLLAVHHSHGLGVVNYARQLLAWSNMARAQEARFDAESIKRRRPDMKRRLEDSPLS